MKFAYRFLKTAAIVTVVVGGVAVASSVILGEEQVKDIAASVRKLARDGASDLIDQRAALERRVETLREEYPEKIAELKGLLRETQTQTAFIQRDLETCDKVLALCEDDISTLDQKIEAAAVDGAIVFRKRTYSIEEAYNMMAKAVETKDRYLERKESLGEEERMLESEIQLLESEMNSLRSEQREFEEELASITRQVESIEHNEKLIKLAKRRENYLNRHSNKDEIASLGALRQHLETIRGEQEETLRSLKRDVDSLNYESRAKVYKHKRATEAEEVSK